VLQIALSHVEVRDYAVLERTIRANVKMTANSGHSGSKVKKQSQRPEAALLNYPIEIFGLSSLKDVDMKKLIWNIVICLALVCGASSGVAQDLGHYERIKVPGPSLEGNLDKNESVRDVSVYLPPGYKINSKRHYPVIYLLHGLTDSDDLWFGLKGKHFVEVRSAADTAWENGAGEIIIVMPNAFTRFFGSMYSNSVTTGNWEGFVAEDLVAYVDQNYRTLPRRESRGLAGHSMGGYGTIRIGMKYPEVFSSLYAMSPCCLAPEIQPAREISEAAAAVRTDEDIAKSGLFVKFMLASAAAWSPNPHAPPFYFDLPVQEGEVRVDVVSRWVANAPIAMAHQYIPALRQYRAIYLDAGNRDFPIIKNSIQDFSAILDQYGIDHVTEEYEGDHVSGIHERLTNKLIPMFTEHLQFQKNTQ
jgi:S-formylglutathione hydrolase FrmB